MSKDLIFKTRENICDVARLGVEDYYVKHYEVKSRNKQEGET